LDLVEARTRAGDAAVARLATVTPTGAPHVVPICFSVIGDTIYSAVDGKPKASPALQRLANVATHPHAAFLVDHYDADWSRLWWVRADGEARTALAADERTAAISALRAKYPQYRDHALEDAVLALDVRAWTGWAAGTSRAPER
jgi:PPOX class probable F420-dependent enzyme